MPWVKLVPRTGQGSALAHDTVSIFKSKILCVTSIRDELGGFVALLYDKETNRMALQPTGESRTSYKVRSNNKVGSRVVSLKKFIDYYNLQAFTGKHYRVARENGLIVIDLNTPIGETKPRGSSKS